MTDNILFRDNFTGSALQPRLDWFNEPAHWELADGKLVLFTDEKTDFWARTHYGFINDNGHCLWLPLTENFEMTTSLRFFPANQYDQAGLIVRCSPDCWLKTSAEYEPHGPAMLGSVVTNRGYSDWATQEFSGNDNTLTLRVLREGADFTVGFMAPDGHWSQMRIAHLEEAVDGAVVYAGLYACSPITAGYRAEFEHLTLRAL
ncbi:MAG: DUF1349 domain-containing protein [Anaerolineae bacterium]|jgi:regulation of enolase protein 1 (concanavalin A-like superfamily)|nr:DUF1349 domain-containing protein [Anaerolineae bacterium]